MYTQQFHFGRLARTTRCAVRVTREELYPVVTTRRPVQHSAHASPRCAWCDKRVEIGVIVGATPPAELVEDEDDDPGARVIAAKRFGN